MFWPSLFLSLTSLDRSCISLQIFFLVVVFGLYHGLIFLPVLLSLVGPREYKAQPKTLRPRQIKASTGVDVINVRPCQHANDNPGFQT